MLSVLIIEDNESLSKVIECVLQDNRYSTRRAATFEQGEELIATAKPDVIILDLGLPCLPIEEVVLGIKDLSRVAPVIVLTGRGEELYGVQAFNNGASGFINKPVTSGELIAGIEAAHSSYQVKKEAKETAENMRAMKTTFREMVNAPD